MIVADIFPSFYAPLNKILAMPPEYIKHLVEEYLRRTLITLFFVGFFKLVGKYLLKANNTDTRAKYVKFNLLPSLLTLNRYLPTTKIELQSYHQAFKPF